MSRSDSGVLVSWDEESNTASIEFAQSDRPRWTVPVTDNEKLIATLRFADDGELLEVELLDAENQLPRGLRPAR